MNDLDKIAAEAWDKMLRTSLREVPCMKMDASGCVAIIKYACDKAVTAALKSLKLLPEHYEPAAADAEHKLPSDWNNGLPVITHMTPPKPAAAATCRDYHDGEGDFARIGYEAATVREWTQLDEITIEFEDGKTVQILERLVTQAVVERHNAAIAAEREQCMKFRQGQEDRHKRELAAMRQDTERLVGVLEECRAEISWHNRRHPLVRKIDAAMSQARQEKDKK